MGAVLLECSEVKMCDYFACNDIFTCLIVE